MKSIVVPVNFSACAANAARYAADLALVLKAELHLIHVIQIPAASVEMNMTEYLYQEMVDSANGSIQELRVELQRRTHGKIDIKTILEGGSLSIKVKELCGELKPYAIILGASGPSLEKFLGGSPVASLLHNLNYPILVIPENTAFRNLNQILLACDLDDIGSGIPHSLPLLKDLRKHFGSRFDIVTVETKNVLANEETIFRNETWKEQLKELCPEIHLIRTPKVEEGILEYLRHHEADLVIVFPKKHGLFDFHVSQSRKFAKHSPIPVMSLHE